MDQENPQLQKIALGLFKRIEGSVERFTKKISYVPQKVLIDWTLPVRVMDFIGFNSKI